jgi:hypothetical protein
MKNYFKLALCLFVSTTIFAQTPAKSYKQSFSGADKRVVIASGSTNLTIEGVSGTEVILESDRSNNEFPPEAEGLKIVSVGSVDNTGMGANVEIEGNTMKIKIPKSKYYGNFTLKIPKELSITVHENGNSYGKWQITGMKGEVEAETSFSTLNINGVSGPIVARGGYGKIYVVYDQLNQSKPNSIYASGAVDITLPADTKANLKLHARNAEVFTDFDIQPLKEDVKPKVVTNEPKDAKVAKVYTNKSGSFSGSNDTYVQSIPGGYNYTTGQGSSWANGTAWAEAQSSSDCNCSNDGSTLGVINGGGVSLSIRSNQGNIYLRKKK